MKDELMKLLSAQEMLHEVEDDWCVVGMNSSVASLSTPPSSGRSTPHKTSPSKGFVTPGGKGDSTFDMYKQRVEKSLNIEDLKSISEQMRSAAQYSELSEDELATLLNLCVLRNKELESEGLLTSRTGESWFVDTPKPQALQSRLDAAAIATTTTTAASATTPTGVEESNSGRGSPAVIGASASSSSSAQKPKRRLPAIPTQQQQQQQQQRKPTGSANSSPSLARAGPVKPTADSDA